MMAAVTGERASDPPWRAVLVQAGAILVVMGLGGLAFVWQHNARDRWFPAELYLTSGAGGGLVMAFETPRATGYEVELVTLGRRQLPALSDERSGAVLEWSVSRGGEPWAAGQPTAPFYRVPRKDDAKERVQALMLGAHEAYPEQWWPQAVLLQGLGRFRAERGQRLELTVRFTLPVAWLEAARPLFRVRVRRQDWEANIRTLKPWAYASTVLVVAGISMVVVWLSMRRRVR